MESNCVNNSGKELTKINARGLHFINSFFKKERSYEKVTLLISVPVP